MCLQATCIQRVARSEEKHPQTIRRPLRLKRLRANVAGRRPSILVQRPSMTEAAMQNSRTLGRSNSFMNPGFHRIAMALTIAAAFGLWGCGGSSTSSPAPPPAPLISVTVTPNSVTVLRDATQAFTAKVTGTTNTAVTWSVEESSGGTIDSAGLYTPPQNGAGTFYVVATSQANSAASGVSRGDCSDAPSND